MHARDSAGRRISLLNEDEEPYARNRYPAAPYYPQPPRTASTPSTPELLRSDSYDSQMTGEPISPMTPLYEPAVRYGPTVADPRAYDEYYTDMPIYAGQKRRPSALSDGRSVSYDDEAISSHALSIERPSKRFPCRFREQLGCEKTFTTSGHASRHSKIHTAEKAVNCSFPGCSKKFTRADNMKQHLETHYKDKTRSSSRPSLSGGDRRASTSGKAPNRSKATAAAAAAAAASANSSPLPSPGGAWDLRGLVADLNTRPSAVHSPTSGLETLAFVAASRKET
ncbi:hypothetical protein VTI74DRAFT_9702 [Chaetomium olivicolor]